MSLLRPTASAFGRQHKFSFFIIITLISFQIYLHFILKIHSYNILNSLT